MIGVTLPRFPCGNSAPILNQKMSNLLSILSIGIAINSIAYDFVTRNRCGGLHLNYFVIQETPLPRKGAIEKYPTAILQSTRLTFIHNLFSPDWLHLRGLFPNLSKRNWKSFWAITTHERLRLRCILDAVVAELYGLDYEDFAWILKECAYSIDEIRQRSRKFDSKGFWRIDKQKSPELRHTVLALRAFKDLKTMGIDAFLSQNDGEGWMIPESLTYSVRDDGTIEFDGPMGITSAVREHLGPRFLPWQLEGEPEETWAECERHARNILGDDGFHELMREIEEGETTVPEGEGPQTLPGQSTLDVFGGR